MKTAAQREEIRKAELEWFEMNLKLLKIYIKKNIFMPEPTAIMLHAICTNLEGQVPTYREFAQLKQLVDDLKGSLDVIREESGVHA